jgi:hypothetical protein
MAGSPPEPLSGAPDDSSREWQRLAAARSIAQIIAADEYVTDLLPLTGEQVPAWIRQLPGAPDWQLLTPGHDTSTALARLAVCGWRDDGGFDGTETISVFTFTGIPLFAEMVRNAARPLRDLDASDITTRVLDVPPGPGRLAMRSSGVLSVIGRRVWGQYSFYLAGSEQPRAGRLIEHQLFIDAQQRERLSGDITALTDAVHRGFVTTLVAARTWRG